MCGDFEAVNFMVYNGYKMTAFLFYDQNDWNDGQSIHDSSLYVRGVFEAEACPRDFVMVTPKFLKSNSHLQEVYGWGLRVGLKHSNVLIELSYS